jgi:hypothetical protein
LLGLFYCLKGWGVTGVSLGAQIKQDTSNLSPPISLLRPHRWCRQALRQRRIAQRLLFSPKETDIKIDWLSTLLVTLLIATSLAFFIGYFPYPYGCIVIALVLIARLTANSGKMTANAPQRILINL